MIDIDNDEQILDRFRDWLRETRVEAAEIDDSTNGIVGESSPIGLDRLIEEFTALRHELKLQTRSARSIEERFENSLATLDSATAAFREVAAQTIPAGSESIAKSLALTIAELEEALTRCLDQWKKNFERLIGPPASAKTDVLDERFRRQSWLRRKLTKSYHAGVIRIIGEDEERSRSERRSLLTALVSGYDLILKRLNRNMGDLGVGRIATVGRIVDPERMVVVEVVESDDRHGEVIEEIRPGYEWKGVLLRPAEVRAVRPRFIAEKLQDHEHDQDLDDQDLDSVREPCVHDDQDYPLNNSST